MGDASDRDDPEEVGREVGGGRVTFFRQSRNLGHVGNFNSCLERSRGYLGGFDPRITCYGEDWEMWVRIAAHYPVWYEPAALAPYRIHRDSLTAR